MSFIFSSYGYPIVLAPLIEKINLTAVQCHFTIKQVSLFFIFFFKINYLFIYFLSALGFCCWVRAFSSCGEPGLLFVAVHGLLVAVASLVAEHRL